MPKKTQGVPDGSRATDGLIIHGVLFRIFSGRSEESLTGPPAVAFVPDAIKGNIEHPHLSAKIADIDLCPHSHQSSGPPPLAVLPWSESFRCFRFFRLSFLTYENSQRTSPVLMSMTKKPRPVSASLSLFIRIEPSTHKGNPPLYKLLTYLDLHASDCRFRPTLTHLCQGFSI